MKAQRFGQLTTLLTTAVSIGCAPVPDADSDADDNEDVGSVRASVVTYGGCDIDARTRGVAKNYVRAEAYVECGPSANGTKWEMAVERRVPGGTWAQQSASLNGFTGNPNDVGTVAGTAIPVVWERCYRGVTWRAVSGHPNKDYGAEICWMLP